MATLPYRPAAVLSPFEGIAPAYALDADGVAALEHADRSYLWKPFTQMAGYVKGTPLVIAEGRGSWLRDVRGRAFLDGVSSLWVNLHGHAHPTIVAALEEQLGRLDHATLLGPTNVPAVELARELVRIAPGDSLTRVFYSDSGSTAVEIAVKMAYQFHAQHRDATKRTRNVFISLTNAYHGDTLGSVSVGGIGLFHQLYEPLLFETVKAPAPDPYHRAFGQDPAAHEAECLAALKARFDAHPGRVAALVMEPLMQGAAGMLAHSADYLRKAAALCRAHGALLILDEPTSVLTPDEADEVLGLLRGMTEAGELTILMITHKFREVTAYADEVTVLRRGRMAGSGKVSDLSVDDMSRMMIGDTTIRESAARTLHSGEPLKLEIAGLFADDDEELPALEAINLKVHSGEILGIAGVSCNGESELIQGRAGQRLFFF